MQSKASTPEEYINTLPDDRKTAVKELRKIILKNLPKGFAEVMSYGMISYVIPLSLFPQGYLGNPNMPVPFMSIASEKNYVSVHNMAIYGNKKLLEWFTKEYSKVSRTKLDMGKSCIRLKKMDQIPYELIGELAGKVTPKDWLAFYEKAVKKRS